MVTYYNRKDLVSFGNYLAEKINSGEKEIGPDLKYIVNREDIENWKHDMVKKKEHQIDE